VDAVAAAGDRATAHVAWTKPVQHDYRHPGKYTQPLSGSTANPPRILGEAESRFPQAAFVIR
jgi:hypothetical protein